MKVYFCQTCRKVWKCDDNECHRCSRKEQCRTNGYDEVKDEECWECRKGNIVFTLRGS